jgi:uncharacterized protein (DUF4415 family)
MALMFDPAGTTKIRRIVAAVRIARTTRWSNARVKEGTRADYGATRLQVSGLIDDTRGFFMARSKNDPAAADNDNPAWNKADFAAARPASEVVPRFIGAPATGELLRRGRGRPAKADRKVNQTLRLDQDVLAAYRALGSGWQARINEVLRAHMPCAGT